MHLPAAFADQEEFFPLEFPYIKVNILTEVRPHMTSHVGF